ncbi:hypothetical protein BD413DRAFT_532356 [Trametes elegans]|nr:hypothetical protein BD413DRAFT_532356 [Trametes elegans]
MEGPAPYLTSRNLIPLLKERVLGLMMLLPRVCAGSFATQLFRATAPTQIVGGRTRNTSLSFKVVSGGNDNYSLRDDPDERAARTCSPARTPRVRRGAARRRCAPCARTTRARSRVSCPSRVGRDSSST